MNARRIGIHLLATLFVTATAANAEDPVNIADPALKTAIETTLGVANPTASDMLALRELDASTRGITDLTGLEYAVNLTRLGLNNNRIADIGPLGGLNQLTYLDLEDNFLTDIHIGLLAQLTNLTELHLGNWQGATPKSNRITDIGPLSGLTSLTVLNLQGTMVADIQPLAGLTNLTVLELDGTPLNGQIGPLGGLTNLVDLEIQECGITDLGPLGNLKKLKKLFANANQIQNLSPLAGLTELGWVVLRSNQIVDLSPLAELNVGILDLGDNRISDLQPLAGHSNMVSLDIKGNTVDTLRPLADLTNLTYLNVAQNQIRDVSPVAGLTGLTYLGISDNPIGGQISALAHLTSLNRLEARYNGIRDVSALAGLMNLRDMALSGNLITDVSSLRNLSRLERLGLEWNLISDLSPIADMVELRYVNLHCNLITDVAPLARMSTLRELTLTENALHPKACVIDIPLIKANNPGVVIGYEGCAELARTLTVSSADGGSVVMPGEGVLTYVRGDVVPVEAVAETGYQFTHWGGTAVDPNVMLDPCSPHTSVRMDADYTLTAHFKPQEEPWRVVYFEDFEGEVGPEWSQNLIDATPIGTRRFLGQFCNDTVTLTLDGVTPGANARLTFDLFILRTWDGDYSMVNGQLEDPTGFGPDIWRLATNGGLQLLETTFSNSYEPRHLGGSKQSYPYWYGRGQADPTTDIAERSSLGYVRPNGLPADSVYHISIVWPYVTNPLSLSFSASGLEGLANESWGVDNVRVEVLDRVVELAASATPGGSVVTHGDGVSACFWGDLMPVEAVADEGYQFTHWSGTAVDADALLDSHAVHTSVIMDANYSLVAHFDRQDEPWSTVYFDDFEGQVGPEWSRDSVDGAPVAARRFLGQFGNETVTLTLPDLPSHTHVRLTFDLFLPRSWDGDGLPGSADNPIGGPGQGGVPDLWSLTLNGDTTLLETTFDNHSTPHMVSFHRQSYPYNYPGSGVLPFSGAAEVGTLGYIWTFRGDSVAKTDSVYHLTFTIENSGSSIRFDFAGSGLQPITDESWGLDNVHVEVLGTVSDVTLAITATAGGSVTQPGEGSFQYAPGTAVPVQAVAATNHHFTHWSGTAVNAGKVADPASPSTSVVVDGDYTLVANFKVDQHRLVISAGQGGYVETETRFGGVTTSWADRPLPLLEHGTQVTVTATPYAGWKFIGWSGTMGSSESPFTFELTQDHSMEAQFIPE